MEDCFDTSSFECVDFQRLGWIIANLTRENLAEFEAEISDPPWRQTEKDTALAGCRGGQRAWRNKEPVLFLSAVTDEDFHPLENEENHFPSTHGRPQTSPARKYFVMCPSSSG